MFSSTTLVCIIDLLCIVDHMCLLACNVCGGITAVGFSFCGILHLTLCGSTSGPAWYPSCPAISRNLPSSGLLHYLWFISVCVGHLSAVFTSSRHCFYSTKSIFYFFAACPIYPAKVSHYYRPTSVDTASVHIFKGITKNIRKILAFRHQVYIRIPFWVLRSCLCTTRSGIAVLAIWYCAAWPQLRSLIRIPDIRKPRESAFVFFIKKIVNHICVLLFESSHQ